MSVQVVVEGWAFAVSLVKLLAVIVSCFVIGSGWVVSLSE